MGGYDNETSRGLTKAKQKSRDHHYNKNKKLYEEYLSSKYQYTMSFVDYKKKIRKKKIT